MTRAPVRPYLGESATDRVTARRRRLLDTAFELLASDGWRQVRIDGLCRQAELNKRYFYESFADLDELAAAVVDELASGLVQTAFASVRAARDEGLSTDELARRAIGAVVVYLTDDPRRARVLFTEIAGTPRARAHRRATVRNFADALSAYGREHHRTTSTDPIAELASALLVGGSAEAIVAWLDGEVAMSREQLIDDLAALWVLTGDGAVAHATMRQPDRGPGV